LWALRQALPLATRRINFLLMVSEQHSDLAPVVRRDRGVLVDLLWPYSLLEQLLFGAIMMFVLTALVVKSGFEAPIVMIGPAYLGIHTVAFMTSPANFVARRLNPDQARLCLGRLGYRRETDIEPEVWIPPLPRWMIWSNSGVKIDVTDEGVQISGPHNVLDLLLNNLKAHGYV